MQTQLTLPLRADLCSGDWQGPFEVVAEYRDGNGTPMVDLGKRCGDRVRVIVQGAVLGSASMRSHVVQTTERAELVVSATESRDSVEAFSAASGFCLSRHGEETAGKDVESRLASEIDDTPARSVVAEVDRNEPRWLVAIDWNNLVHRSWHAAPTAPHKALWGTLRYTVDQFPGCAIVLADEGGDSFRRELDTAYKARRKPLEDGLRLFRDQARAVCEAIDWQFLAAKSFEADDVLASLASQLIEHDTTPHIVIVTSDKDLQQLVGSSRVTVYCPYGENRGRVETWDVTERWGVPPSQLGDLLALVGDTSDGVAGVDGVGIKTAAEWLRQHKSLQAIETYAGQMACSKKCPKALLTLSRSGERLALSRRLIELRRDVPLPDCSQLVTRAATSPPADWSERLIGVVPATLLADLTLWFESKGSFDDSRAGASASAVGSSGVDRDRRVPDSDRRVLAPDDAGANGFENGAAHCRGDVAAATECNGTDRNRDQQADLNDRNDLVGRANGSGHHSTESTKKTTEPIASCDSHASRRQSSAVGISAPADRPLPPRDEWPEFVRDCESTGLAIYGGPGPIVGNWLARGFGLDWVIHVNLQKLTNSNFDSVTLDALRINAARAA